MITRSKNKISPTSTESDNEHITPVPDESLNQSRFTMLQNQLDILKQEASHTKSKAEYLSLIRDQNINTKSHSNTLPFYDYLCHTRYRFLIGHSEETDARSSQQSGLNPFIDKCFCPLEVQEWTQWNDIVEHTWNDDLKRLNKQGRIFPGISHIQYAYKGLQRIDTEAPFCQDTTRRVVYQTVEFPAVQAFKKANVNSVHIEHQYNIPGKFRDTAADDYKVLGLDKRLMMHRTKRRYDPKSSPAGICDKYEEMDEYGIPEPGGCFVARDKVLNVSMYLPEHELTKHKYQNFTTVCGDIGSDQSVVDVYIRGENNSYDTSVWNDFCDITSTIVQTYSHMVKYGSQYGYATSERGFIFLHVPYTQPHKVYYHYVNNNIQPGLASGLQLDMAVDNGELKKSAVVGMITVLKKALEDTEPYFGVAHNDSLRQLKTVFEYKSELISQNAHNDHQSEEEVIRGSEDTNNCENESKIISDCDDTDQPMQSEAANDINITAEAGSNTEIEEQPRSAHAHTSPTTDENMSSRFRKPLDQYCTMECIGFLRDRIKLFDKKCPNYLLHKTHTKDMSSGPRKPAEFINLFKTQLDDGIGGFEQIDLKYGIFGNMYKVTLYPDGYTLVARATELKDMFKLKLEYKRYLSTTIDTPSKLRRAGCCLGYIDFRDDEHISLMLRRYNLPIMEMLLLAYMGEFADNVKPDLYEILSSCLLWGHSIPHKVTRNNVVWNKEKNDHLMVSFDDDTL